jgi:hypothetical protein
MNHLKLLFIPFLLALSFLSSCEKSNFYNNTGGGGRVPEKTGDVITAIRNKTETWSLSSGYAQYKKNGDLVIYFMGEGLNKLTIELTSYNGVQTYQLNGSSRAVLIQDGVEFRDTYGWVKILAHTDNYLTGKFEFAMQSTFNNINLNFSEGEFSVPMR